MAKSPLPPVPPIAPALLEWYRRGHRELPWRDTTDPYRIWISEIMLQQTQVETVLPYYERWFAHFPTLAALARAEEERVLKAWEGLGYYARARHLHAAASEIVERHGGEFPDDFDAVVELKGVGRSTAGAICALAFGHRVPILDGNVKRVLARLSADGGAPDKPATLRRWWALAEKLLPEGTADNRAYGNALMELGATVCLPKNPACLFCPLNTRCAAFQRGRPEDFPASKPRKPRPHRHWLALFVQRRDGALLARKREREGLWGGLWEFPTLEWSGRGLDKALAEDFARRRWGTPGTVKGRAAVVEHAFTHFDLTLTVVRVPVRPGLLTAPLPAGAEWLTLRQLRDKPLPKPYLALLDQLAQKKLHA